MDDPDKLAARNRFWGRAMIVGLGLLALLYLVVTLLGRR